MKAFDTWPPPWIPVYRSTFSNINIRAAGGSQMALAKIPAHYNDAAELARLIAAAPQMLEALQRVWASEELLPGEKAWVHVWDAIEAATGEKLP